jgi:hypothetical protein
MALINDPNITAQIRDLANTGTIDTTIILSILNSVLPAGQQITVGSTLTTGIYKRFGDFDKINAKVEVVTTGLWSGGAGQLTQFFTSSEEIYNSNGTPTNDGQFYWNVYDKHPVTEEETAEVQFAIAYGHINGGGSVSLSTNPDALLPTKSTYAQYRAMLLDNPSEPFQFEDSALTAVSASSIYVINIGRARYREEMDAGNWQLQLSGSNGLFRFIDDSNKKFSDTFGRAGRVFKVVSGSLELGSQSDAIVANSAAPGNGLGYGLFYPDRGIILLNPAAISDVVGNVTFSTGSLHSATATLAGGEGTTFNAYNQARLLSAIQKGGDFDARRTENVSTQHFFVRATNREFNYSNNPTYVDINGNFTEPSFETDPRTFITTIGLYNDSNELIAVAKTSQPIAKSFDKEVLVKVKLSF